MSIEKHGLNFIQCVPVMLYMYINDLPVLLLLKASDSISEFLVELRDV